MHLWEAIADHYKGNAWVAGYNLMNEPADESRAVVGPFYARLVGGHPGGRPRPHPVPRRQHVLDRVRLLRRAVRERRLHAARLRAGRPGPQPDHYDRGGGGGEVPGALGVRPRGRARRSWSASSAPIYTGDEARDAERRRILADQLDLYRRHEAGFATWMYKDIGRQGLIYVRPDSPYGALVGGLRGQEDAARRRPVGQRPAGDPEVTQPVQDLVAREVAGLRPVSVGPLRLGADAAAQHHPRAAARPRVRRAVPGPRRRRARRPGGLVRLRLLRGPRDPARPARERG